MVLFPQVEEGNFQNLPEHRLESGGTAWHVGVSALTIWLTRNWSTEEILTIASQTVSADPKAPLKTPK